jgi:MFS family permease
MLMSHPAEDALGTAAGVKQPVIESRDVQLGLSANWRQFSLLVVVNGFVGAMVGLERAVLPIVAVNEFAVGSTAAVLSFIATFGLTKALSNLTAGWLMDRRGRRSTLLIGWLLGFPVPILIFWAPSWWWIVAANALLGVNQGLTWSTTVVMKIDLVGPQRRGFAMGLNEFAGYVAVAIAALAGGFAATSFGLRAGPAYLGLAICAVGLLLSWRFVHDTSAHVELEEARGSSVTDHPRITHLLHRSLWSDRGLFSVSQAGFMNNLNDGLAWGIFPLLFVAAGMSVRQTSAMAAIYPAVWGISQLGTGALSDRWGRKWFIVAGMIVQGMALVAIALTHQPFAWCIALVALGIGTALVYPTLLAAVGDIARPSWRAATVGVYRLWRDLGYVAGALVAGAIADVFGIAAAIGSIGVMTAVSGAIFGMRFREIPVAGKW